MSVHELMSKSEPHINIINAFAKTWDILGRFSKPVVSISGGADSDVVLDMVHRLDDERKVTYMWINTGLEYQATRKHLDFLEDKYSIKIERVPTVKPIPLAVKEFGYPFISKIVSEFIYSLQLNNFDFSSRNSYETDKELYPNCLSRVRWWHSVGSCNMYNINRYKLLKEFMSEYPPEFQISSKCCDYTKKLPSEHFMRDVQGDLKILGMRKAEGGIRSLLRSCFSLDNDRDYAVFNPIFYFTVIDRIAYEKIFEVTHSECYTKYGLKRTGCVGCPYNLKVFSDFETVQIYEPELIRAAENVFAPAYEYTKKFQEYRALHSDETLPLFPEGGKSNEYERIAGN